jgi:hypothetical protein
MVQTYRDPTSIRAFGFAQIQVNPVPSGTVADMQVS